MYKIQTLNKISSTGLELMSRDDYEIATEINNPDAIVLRSFKMHDMELPQSLKSVARAGAGVNNIPIDKCTEKGIVVFNTPGANANGVKELVIASLLISSRDIVGGIEWAKTLKGKGTEVGSLVEKGKSNFAGTEIKGKKLGVIGLGAIGSLVANAAVSLGMRVYGYDPFMSVDAAWRLSNNVINARNLDNLLDCDFITLHVGLTDDTKNMINAEKLKNAKDGVKIINMARGGLVDNKALIAALKSGKVGKYVTDFPDDELIGVENVISIPHLGASTEESEETCAVMAVQQTKEYLEKGNIKNSVNFPNCEMNMSSNFRLVIANKNVPNMVGQISSILAAENINISEYLNKAKGEIAYNIIDVDHEIPNDLVQKIKGIDGVIMVRSIKK